MNKRRLFAFAFFIAAASGLVMFKFAESKSPLSGSPSAQGNSQGNSQSNSQGYSQDNTPTAPPPDSEPPPLPPQIKAAVNQALRPEGATYPVTKSKNGISIDTSKRALSVTTAVIDEQGKVHIADQTQPVP